MNQNVLLIVVDQVIATTLGAYGGICKTPNLDRLASEGITFDRAYTPIAICSPARASIFTGQLPHRHGILYNVTHDCYGIPELPEDNHIITQYLQKTDYTCGYVGKWHVGECKGPREYGFEGTAFPCYGVPSNFVSDYDDFLKEKGHSGMRDIRIKNVVAAKGGADLTMPTSEADEVAA